MALFLKWRTSAGLRRTARPACALGTLHRGRKAAITFTIPWVHKPDALHIGVAIGDQPAGPFIDSGAPLLTGGDGFEAIDPMVFTDPKSGTTYLYAGGSAGAKLRMFELNPDMVSLGTELSVETPPHFTEGAFMHERNGRYYLSYSSGSTGNASYAVHYAVSETPAGPWTYEGVILKSDKDHKGPGHHSFLHNPSGGTDFIVYHRWNHQRGMGPFNASRQIAIDRLDYDVEGRILPVVMTAGNIHLKTAPTVLPPGVVICHSPQATGRYIGSPSLTVLPNGTTWRPMITRSGKQRARMRYRHGAPFFRPGNGARLQNCSACSGRKCSALRRRTSWAWRNIMAASSYGGPRTMVKPGLNPKIPLPVC